MQTNSKIVTNLKSLSFLMLCIFHFFLLTPSVSAQQQKELIVRYNKSELFVDKSQFFPKFLKLALDETLEDFGPYKLAPVEIDMAQQRGISMLKAAKNIDVIWTMTSIEREENLQAVYIPLLKGLLGHRVFLIRAGEQSTFSNIKTGNDLKELVAGQGINWPDTKILVANNLRVNAAPGELLYKMLQHERFDYFPRGISEISQEVSEHPDLIIEKSIMLYYTAPFFFFVNKDNSELAQRLEIGLSRAINNEKFDILFQQLRDLSEIMTVLNIKNRNVIKLKNPLLSDKTKALIERKELWLTID